MAGTTPTECLFCRIIAREIPSEPVYEDADVYAFRDIHPETPTHALIVPKRHITDISVAEAEDGALLVALVRAANEIARREGVASSGYRLVSNVGPDAGQSVFHLHLHLLGGRPMGYSAGEMES